MAGSCLNRLPPVAQLRLHFELQHCCLTLCSSASVCVVVFANQHPITQTHCLSANNNQVSIQVKHSFLIHCSAGLFSFQCMLGCITISTNFHALLCCQLDARNACCEAYCIIMMLIKCVYYDVREECRVA